jgi:hypothetical protein
MGGGPPPASPGVAVAVGKTTGVGVASSGPGGADSVGLCWGVAAGEGVETAAGVAGGVAGLVAVGVGRGGGGTGTVLPWAEALGSEGPHHNGASVIVASARATASAMASVIQVAMPVLDTLNLPVLESSRFSGSPITVLKCASVGHVRQGRTTIVDGHGPVEGRSSRSCVRGD